jgi:hypothetical protein
MPAKKKPTSKKKLSVIAVMAILAVAAVLLTGTGFAFAATQESHDSFCGSCHSQPESTFYERSAAASAVDLASFHAGQTTRCIDCHSGAGVTGRINAELLGARNAFHWFTGTAVQPAKLTKPIGDDSCLKCHAGVTQVGYKMKNTALPGSLMRGEGRAGHWHQFLARWQGFDPQAATCTSCHGGHSTASTAENGFMDIQAVEAVCEACHRSGGGD